MGTRSRIGILEKNGKVTSIYCHWDGYPSHNGRILRESYTNEKKVRQLMKLGDISALGSLIGKKHDFDSRPDNYTTAYGRDRDEEDTQAKRTDFETFVNDLAEEYQYLFDPATGTWVCYVGSGGEDILTTQAWVAAMRNE